MNQVHTFTTPGKFVSYMIQNPNQWGNYVSKCGFTEKSPIEQGLPWLAMEAIEFLEKFLSPNMKAIEFGGGGSTLFFAKRIHSVTCIESSQEWIGIIGHKLRTNKIQNVDFEYRSFEGSNKETFKASSYITQLPKAKFDIILIDGPEIEGYQARPICFEWAEKHINKGGIIIVDDAWRYEQLHQQNVSHFYKEYISIGPSRKGITKTDIYFY